MVSRAGGITRIRSATTPKDIKIASMGAGKSPAPFMNPKPGVAASKFTKVDRTKKITPELSNQIRAAYDQGHTTPTTIRAQIDNKLSLTQVSRLMKDYGLKSKAVVSQPSLIAPRASGITGVKFPNSKIEQQYLKDLMSRAHYPKNHKNYVNDKQFKEKYYSPNTSNSTIEKINSTLKSEYKIQTPLRHGSKAEQVRTLSAERRATLEKISDPKYEKKIGGDRKVHLHHMDSKNSNVTTSNLGYTQANRNVNQLKNAEYKINALYRLREKVIKENPKDLKQKLEEINTKGLEIVSRPDVTGFLNFKIVNPSTLKVSNYGVHPINTVGQGIIKNKPIKKLTDTDKAIIELNRPALINRFKKDGGRVGFSTGGDDWGKQGETMDIKTTKTTQADKDSAKTFFSQSSAAEDVATGNKKILDTNETPTFYQTRFAYPDGRVFVHHINKITGEEVFEEEQLKGPQTWNVNPGNRLQFKNGGLVDINDVKYIINHEHGEKGLDVFGFINDTTNEMLKRR